MSYERGLAAINLQPTDKIPHTEYLSNRKYIKKKTGLDIDDPDEGAKARQQIAEYLDYDFVWSTFGYDFGTPRSHMGRARFSETEELTEAHYAFDSVEDVLSYDPLEDADNIPTIDELTEAVRNQYQNKCEAYPDAVVPGGFYNSVFTWNIVTFGWDLFMEAAMEDMKRFDKVMEGFFKMTMMVVDAHIKAEVPIFNCHDDIVWASGTVFPPDWMHQYVFPRLKKMWTKLRDAGIKVIFTSDGNFNEYIDDLVECGAQGFIFEPLTDLEYIVEDYGDTHVIIGNADCRILMRNDPDEIRAEVKRCMDIGRDCPGFFMAVGNHIPYNVPVSAIECYMEAYEDMAPR